MGLPRHEALGAWTCYGELKAQIESNGAFAGIEALPMPPQRDIEKLCGRGEMVDAPDLFD